MNREYNGDGNIQTMEKEQDIRRNKYKVVKEKTRKNDGNERRKARKEEERHSDKREAVTMEPNKE